MNRDESALEQRGNLTQDEVIRPVVCALHQHPGVCSVGKQLAKLLFGLKRLKQAFQRNGVLGASD